MCDGRMEAKGGKKAKDTCKSRSRGSSLVDKFLEMIEKEASL